jgi:hypothetical protein
MSPEWLITLASQMLVAVEEAAPLLDEPVETVTFVGEQILVVATVVATVAALPGLISFLVERSKLKERIQLSLEDAPPPAEPVVLAGLEELEAGIEDLVDCARYPEAYRQGNRDNEIVIIGPPMSGRRSLAQRFAQRASLDRVITVYNTRHPEVLSEAKRLIGKNRRARTMLLLPDLDKAFARDDDELRAELITLIETAASHDRITVIATATEFVPDSDLDNLFAIKLVMPTIQLQAMTMRTHNREAHRLHLAVAKHYVRQALEHGLILKGLDEEQVVMTISARAGNPAEIRDIVNLAMLTGTWHQRQSGETVPVLTRFTLEAALNRVVVNAAASHDSA